MGRLVHSLRIQSLILICLVISLPGCVSISPPARQAMVPLYTAQAALEQALSVEGAPYLLGGRGPDQFDCSGLITWAYKMALGRDQIFMVGSQRTTDAAMQDLWQLNVVLLPPEAAAPGDIVFITNTEERITHGGLFVRWLDDDKTILEFINASSYVEYQAVVIDHWPVKGTKRGQWFAGIGRLKAIPERCGFRQ